MVLIFISIIFIINDIYGLDPSYQYTYFGDEQVNYIDFNELGEFENLDVANVGEKFPDDSQLFYLLEEL